MTLQPGTTYNFHVDLSNLEGTSVAGGSVNLQEHRGVELFIDNWSHTSDDGGDMTNVGIGGFFGCDDNCHYTESSTSKDYTVCEFGKNMQTFTVQNQGSTSMTVDMRIDVDGNDSGCSFIDALTSWFSTVLILIAVCCGLGICGVICCVCGGTALCCSACNKNKQETVVTTTNQTQMAHQSQMNQPVGGSSIPAPAQPNYAGAPGAATEGTTDVSMYSNGLAPGWEAKLDPASGKPFWVNHNDQTSVWEDPRGTRFAP